MAIARSGAPAPRASRRAAKGCLRAPAMLAFRAVLAVWAALLILTADPAAGECPLRIAVIGDRAGGHEPGKYEAIVAEVARLQPDVIMTVGDMIEGYQADTAAVKAEWKEYKEIIKPLTAPIHFTPGNHDIWDARSRALYQRYADEPHYSFDVGSAHFIVLDNGRYPTIDAFPADQLAWLRDDLRAHRDAGFTLVFFHIPYWTATLAEGKQDALHNLFVEYGVDGVFTGHDHVYFSGRYNGVLYTGVGSSGAYCAPGLTGLAHHFVWVTLGAGGLAVSPVKIGSVLPSDEVTAKDYKLAGRIQESALEISKVEVGTALAVSEAPVKVTLRNLNDDRPLQVALKWEVPPGWVISPSEAAAEIAPQGSSSFDFTAGTDLSIYPAPTISIPYPYGEGRTIDLEKALPVERTAYAHKVTRPPDIDGKVTEKAWREPVTALFAPDGTPMTAEPASFYFAYDLDNLYVAARCSETQMGSLAAAFKAHDDPVYAEDCIGFFFQSKTADGPVYQIYFSARGTVFDQLIKVSGGVAADTDPAWDGKYKVRTHRGKDYWSVEAKIPLEQLGVRGKSGREWAVNFRRKQKRLATAADWQVPTGYDPRDYGRLVFK